VAHWTLDGHGIDRHQPKLLPYAQEEGPDPNPDNLDQRAPGQKGQYVGVMHGEYCFSPDLGMKHGALFFYGADTEGWMDGGLIPGAHDQLTVTFWMKPSRVREQVVLTKFPAGHGEAGWQIRLHDDNQVSFRIGSAESFTELRTRGGFDKFTGAPAAEAYTMGPLPRHHGWTHIAATFDGSQARIYVNGRLSNELDGVPQSTKAADVPLWLGRGAPGRPELGFHGLVDDIKIFRRALDPETVTTESTIPHPSRDIEHPVLIHDDDSEEFRQLRPSTGAVERLVDELMSLSEADVRALVPTNNPDIKQVCPETGAAMPKLEWEWNPLEPDQITALKNGQRFVWDPENLPERYAEPDGVDRFVGPLGQIREQPYYRNPAMIERRSKFHYTAQIDLKKYAWLMPRLRATAWTYHLDGDEAKARRVAVILDQFALNTPNWLPSVDTKQPGTWYQSSLNYAEPPGIVVGGSIGVISENWNGSIRQGFYFAQALDLIYESQALREISIENGLGSHGMVLRIEENLIRDAIDFARAQQWARILHTNVPRLFLPAGYTGQILHRPELVHWFFDINKNFPYHNWGFTADMHSNDSATDQAAVDFATNVNALTGHIDPEGYVNPVNGRHFTDLNQLEMTPEIRGWGVGPDEPPAKYTLLNVHDLKLFPNGAMPQINDTPEQHAENLPDLLESTSELL